MSSRSAGLRGRQRPRIEHVPGAPSSAGDEAAEFAAEFGLFLDPWQRHVLRGALGERLDGRWQAFEAGLIVPRQNGKGAVLEALELYWLFMRAEDRLILHSAHEFKTAREGFLRVRGLIEASGEYGPEVRQFYASTGGECGIELRNGKRLRFVARSTGAGRGFSPDKLVLDEAYNLPEAAIEAVLPSVGARPNPQVWYVSSPGDQTIAPCDVLARVRRRGMKGEDPALYFAEWSVPYDEFGRIEGDPASPNVWAVANPSLGIRKTAERIGNFQRSMSAAGFAREELGVGNWPAEDAGSSVFGEGRWVACFLDVEPPPVVAIGIGVSLDTEWGSIASADVWPDSRVNLSAVDRRPGTDWLVSEAKRIQDEYRCGVVIDEKCPDATLPAALRDAGVNLTVVTLAEYIEACGELVNRVKAGTVTHQSTTDLDDAVSAAAWRTVSDRKVFGRKQSSGDISMLEAAALALHGAHMNLNYDVLASIG